MMVTGIAAPAHAWADPYTSMRLLAEASVRSEDTSRPAYCAVRGWLGFGDVRDLPLRDIQMTECVKSAHDPVVVLVPVGLVAYAGSVGLADSIGLAALMPTPP